MKLSTTVALGFLVCLSLIKAQGLPYEPPTPISCSPTVNCPEEYPCCSQFWTCGTGPVCVTGCNPKNSFNDISCVRGPAFMPESFVKIKKIKKSPKKTKKDEIDEIDEEFGEYSTEETSDEGFEEIESEYKDFAYDFEDQSESVYIHADDDELEEYFAANSKRKRSELDHEVLSQKNDVKINNNKEFRFSDLLIKHKVGKKFVAKSDKAINSYAGDHMRINGEEIIPWTEYLIADNERDAMRQWDNVGFTYSGMIKKVMNSEEDADDYLYLAMPKRSTGTLLTTARNMLYGKVGVSMKTGQGRGVITTIVLFSSVHDEIDFEFVGSDLLHAQTNYYHQGELIHTRMTKAYAETNIHDDWHYYEIDWNEDRIHWLIDSRIVRTLQKVDTWDPLREVYKYPQTPMKLHISIWPGGSETNSPGTISWAGGLVDWENAEDILEKGEFDCKIEYVSIEPYFNEKMADHRSLRVSQSKVQPTKRMGYVFEEADEVNDFMEENVKLTNEEVVYLKSLKHTGLNPT